MEKYRFLIWLNVVLDGDASLISRLIDKFGSAEAVYYAETEEYYRKLKNISDLTVDKLSDKSMKPADECMEFCERYNVRILTLDDPDYPDVLKYIHLPPRLLYVMGERIDINELFCVAVVGTRACTKYGLNTARKISYELAAQGATIVSGIADGIDAEAHKACIEAGGKTIAILGNGLSVAYPAVNRNLYKSVLQSGMLVTEFPPYSKPKGYHFPVRNRIISGLSQATAVIESHERSGALITADFALTQGKSIYAIPAKIGDAAGAGNLELIKKGAKILTSATDILEEFELLYPHIIKINRKLSAPLPIDNNREETVIEKKKPQIVKQTDISETNNFEQMTPMQKKIAELILKSGALTADEIAEHGISMDDTLMELTTMEIFGMVTAVPGGKYKLNNRKE